MPASASDAGGMFAVKGVGALSCGAYLAAADAGDRELAQYSGYIAGYLSAYNEHREATFDLVPWQSMETSSRSAMSANSVAANSRSRPVRFGSVVGSNSLT